MPPLPRIIKHPVTWIIIAIIPIAYLLRHFLVLLLFGFFYGPIAAYKNYFEYHIADLFSLFILPIAFGTALIGVRFRASIIGKLLIIISTFVWALWGLAEIGSWC